MELLGLIISALGGMLGFRVGLYTGESSVGVRFRRGINEG